MSKATIINSARISHIDMAIEIRTKTELDEFIAALTNLERTVVVLKSGDINLTFLLRRNEH